MMVNRFNENNSQTSPSMLAYHSEWLPLGMTSTWNGSPFGMAAEQPPKAPLAHPPKGPRAHKALYPTCPSSQLQRALGPAIPKSPFAQGDARSAFTLSITFWYPFAKLEK